MKKPTHKLIRTY